MQKKPKKAARKTSGNNTRAARNNQRLRDDIRRTTFFMHGTCIISPGAEVGNPKYRITTADAIALLNRKNTWAIMLLAFIDTGIDQGTKTELHTVEHHMTRQQINQHIEALQTHYIAQQNLNTVCSVGFFMVPDHTVDLAATRKDIIRLFTAHNPWDRAHTQTATLIRKLENDLMPQEAA